ncbi:MAG: Pycsar system effector family protein [Chitinophagales bacterium]
MNYNELLTKVSAYVHAFYHEHQDNRLLYHNLSHTKEIVEACKKIGNHYRLQERENFIVCAAAWFHDTGYLTTDAEIHEIKSAEIAENFLSGLGVHTEDIYEIRNCILATKLPQSPNTLLEKIVCDADLFHLGTDLFKENSKLLKKEIEAFTNQTVDRNEWRANNIRLLESHNYHTDYCQQVLEKGKSEHIEKLRKKLEEKSPENPLIQNSNGEDHNPPNMNQSNGNPDLANPATIKLEQGKPNGKHKDGYKQPKTTRSEKSIETMFRIASANHQRLSSMADNKAHIMISVNSIIMSVVVALLVKKLDDYGYLIVPTILLLVMNVITIIYSVLATRPQIPNGIFTREQVVNKSINLLFFGNFYKMNYTDYDWGMKRMMNDRDFLYESLINDMYWHGVVLGKKYRLLRTSYSVFMYGIAIALIAFVISIFVPK